MENTRHAAAALSKDGEKAREHVLKVTDAAVEKGRATWKDLRDQGKEAVAGTQKSVKEAWNDAQKLLQKHPGKAVAVALLVGAAIGGILMAMRNND